MDNTLQTIQTFYPTDGGRAPLVSPQSKHLVWVRAYQGNLNDNFDIYHTDTRVQPRPPANCNLNNRPEIGGIVCLLSGSSTPTLTPTPTPSPSTSSGPSACDLNQDGSINILDFQSLVNVILGIVPNLGTYDINKDGQVNILDAQTLVNVILGKSSCP